MVILKHSVCRISNAASVCLHTNSKSSVFDAACKSVKNNPEPGDGS